ncbi:kinase-like protein [Polyplosphaeria fusca]|uniref:Kinase-like protein n=1 Tax=Polyplosphaeria fusca TaxID=682080 RepID=A0A9P4QTY2_9PLEO|nr:kinase-like protein [Polyplosphaeria fusca]
MSFTAKMDPGEPFEEEQLPWYNPDQFYPIRIGEILDSSYKLLGKLGYCAYSTVWLYINPWSIMLTVADETVLHDFEKAEVEKPSPTKLGLPRDFLWGLPVLCDFGEARIGESHRGLIQPNLYRAPEVLFEMEWSSSVDIWNVAALTWDLFENRHLFNAMDENLQPSATHHVAEMTAYLGLPSLEYIQKSEITKKVFDEQGRWKGAGGTVVPHLSLEESSLNFIRSMLEWLPEKRKKASGLLEDPWMTGAIP